MKKILEIQNLEKQIHSLQAEVEKCPASVELNNYKKVMLDGRERFAQLDAQANDLLKNFEIETNNYSKYRGNSDIVKKRNQENISMENLGALIADANGLVGDLSEENRKVEDIVRRSEEIVRKSEDLTRKLTEAKIRANTLKAKIEEKRQEIQPKIAEIRKKIAELEPQVEDKEKYEKYKTLKANGIFPVYVALRGNYCGGCGVELPLNFIEKLKTHKMLPCESCGKIIMFDQHNV